MAPHAKMVYRRWGPMACYWLQKPHEKICIRSRVSNAAVKMTAPVFLGSSFSGPCTYRYFDFSFVVIKWKMEYQLPFSIFHFSFAPKYENDDINNPFFIFYWYQKIENACVVISIPFFIVNEKWKMKNEKLSGATVAIPFFILCGWGVLYIA